MNLRVLVFVAAVVGAAAASVGVASLASPLGSANAGPGGADPGPPVAEMLEQMAPGAVVDRQADGSVSIQGTATPAAQAEIQRVIRLEEAGPNSVRCSGAGATTTCRPIADRDVVPALRAGETIYGRTVYRSITKAATDRGAAIFRAGELVCGAPQHGGAMACSGVDRVQPVIRAGETLFVTYRPFNVTFDAQGIMTVHVAPPTIPLVQAAP